MQNTDKGLRQQRFFKTLGYDQTCEVWCNKNT